VDIYQSFERASAMSSLKQTEADGLLAAKLEYGTREEENSKLFACLC
jgi:hypothetical protein